MHIPPTPGKTVLPVMMAIIIHFPGTIHGEEPQRDMPVYLMEQIIVTETPHEAASETVIGREEILIRRNDTIGDILRDFPGAVVTTGAKNSSEIMLRGFDSDDILIMVDGRPVNDPYYGTIDLSTLGSGNIERIRIVKGPSSVRYGPNAMGGVVNIVTGGYGDGPAVGFEGTIGHGRDFRGDLVHRGKARGIGYRVHIGRNDLRGYSLSDDYDPTPLENGGLRNNSDYHRTDLDTRVFFGGEDSGRWQAGLSHSHLRKGLPSSIYDARYWRFTRWDRTAADLAGEVRINETIRLKTNLYAERFVNELVDYRDDTYNGDNIKWNSTHDNRSVGLLVSSSYAPSEKATTYAGFQIRGDESNRQPDAGEDWEMNRAITSWLFFEHERLIADGLLMRAGISGLMFSHDDWNKNTGSVDPSLNLEWIVRGYTVTGSFSRAGRFPNLNQLYSERSGNRDLDPEFAYKGEISVSRDFAGILRLTASGFTNRIRDMIYRSGRNEPYRNIEKATLDGGELGAGVTVGRFEVRSGLLLLDARDGDGRKLAHRPRWKVDSGIGYTPSDVIRVYLNSRYVGPRWTDDGIRMEPYNVMDSGIVVGGHGYLSLTLGVENMFDVNYEEEYGFPMAGRVLRAGIDVRR